MHTLEGNVVRWIKSADQAELWNVRQVSLSFNQDFMFSLQSASRLINIKEGDITIISLLDQGSDTKLMQVALFHWKFPHLEAGIYITDCRHQTWSAGCIQCPCTPCTLTSKVCWIPALLFLHLYHYQYSWPLFCSLSKHLILFIPLVQLIPFEQGQTVLFLI